MRINIAEFVGDREERVIYASDWPVLPMRRVIPEARALHLPAEVGDNYLYNNARGFFFGKDD